MTTGTLLTGFLLLTSIGASAQETSAQRMISEALAAMPMSASSRDAFVPEHWRIHSEATGDLDGDGREDVAMTVTPNEEDPANAAAMEQDDFFPAPDIVVVLFATRDGGFQRVGVNSRLSTRNFDGRPHHMEIRKRVLVVNSNFGNSSATDVTYRFRYDSAAAALMLIGYDHESYSRPGTDDAFHTSENYLTGERVETTRYVDRRKNAKAVYGREKSKRKKIKRYRVRFEEVDYDDDFENPEHRPFAMR